MLKKFLCLGLVLCLLAVGLAGCGKSKKNNDVSSASELSSLPETSSAVVVTPTPARTAKAAQINVDELRIRSKPSTDSDVLGYADRGSKLALLIETPSDGWYQVEYEGETAYISAEYSSVVEVTLEEYNRLRAGESGSDDPASSAASAPASDDPQGGAAAAASQAGESSASSVGGEDGE